MQAASAQAGQGEQREEDGEAGEFSPGPSTVPYGALPPSRFKISRSACRVLFAGLPLVI